MPDSLDDDTAELRALLAQAEFERDALVRAAAPALQLLTVLHAEMRDATTVQNLRAALAQAGGPVES